VPSVINMLCDVIADVADVNMKTHPLTSASSCARICGNRKVAAEDVPAQPSIDCLIWGALQ